MNIDKFIVEVQVHGPICSRGSFGESERITVEGNTSPREVVGTIEPGFVAVAPDVTSRALTSFKEEEPVIEDGPDREDDRYVDNDFNDEVDDDDGWTLEVRVEGVLDEKLREAVEEAVAVGTATGQKLHSCRLSSQNKSISNLRNPSTNRLDKQSAELSSSYLENGKQAAVRETAGFVTKLIGICQPRSL